MKTRFLTKHDTMKTSLN